MRAGFVPRIRKVSSIARLYFALLYTLPLGQPRKAAAALAGGLRSAQCRRALLHRLLFMRSTTPARKVGRCFTDVKSAFTSVYWFSQMRSSFHIGVFHIRNGVSHRCICVGSECVFLFWHYEFTPPKGFIGGRLGITALILAHKHLVTA